MSDEKITAAGEEAARSHILELVADYCDKYHNKKGPFEEGQRIPYASRVYDSSEMVNLVDSALEFWLTSGRYTDRFEKGWPVIWESATVPWSIPVLQPI